MPELPEVETIAHDLRGLVTGARISGARSNWARTLRSHDAAEFAGGVAGREIQGVGRRGKQLLVWLGPKTNMASAAGDPSVAAAPAVDASAVDASAALPSADDLSAPAPASGALAVLTVHLKMTGQLFVVPAGTPEDRHVHLALALSDGREIRFRDIRKFGRIGLYQRDPETGLPTEGAAVGVLASGAEPLADDLTPGRFGEMLARRRGRLKTLLLNQDFLAGVGNIYADEALWRARLHPLRDARSLRPDDARRLHAALRAVLAEAVERRGSSVDDYTAPEGDGSMQEHLAVYQRSGEPCLRCGRPIRRIVVGGRATHFCPWCQRLRAPGRAAAVRGAAAGAATAGPATARPAGAQPAAGGTATAGHAARTSRAATRGPRWTELPGVGVLGRTADEEAAALERAEERRRRTAASRAAAATRRAAARSGFAGGPPGGGNA